jgi:hypothetical protein
MQRGGHIMQGVDIRASGSRQRTAGRDAILPMQIQRSFIALQHCVGDLGRVEFAT